MAKLHVDTLGVSEHGALAAAQADPEIGRAMCLMGNVDPVQVLQIGTEDNVRHVLSACFAAPSALAGAI